MTSSEYTGDPANGSRVDAGAEQRVRLGLRLAGAAVFAVAALVFTLALEGPGEWILGTLLVGTAVVVADPRARIRLRDLPRSFVVVVCVFIALFGAARVTAGAVAHHDTLLQPPITGGSDQVDFTAMAYTFYRDSLPGISSGSEVAEPILMWAAERGIETELVQRWASVAQRDPERLPNTYRPHLYPLALGTLFKFVGYRPAYGPALNAAFHGLTCVTILLIGLRWLSLAAAMLSVSLFLTVQLTLHWAYQNMPETLVGLLMAVLVALALHTLTAEGNRAPIWPVASGVTLGLLVLAKQLFFMAGGIVVLSWLGWALLRRRYLLVRIVILGLATTVVLLPWLVYNVAHSGRTDLMLGTAGWHDMPSAYSQEYLDGENRFRVRAEMFRQYTQRTGTELNSSADRALAGREMFLENLRGGEYWDRLPGLVIRKIELSLAGAWSNQVIRLLALGGVFVLAFRPAKLAKRHSEVLLIVLVPWVLAPHLVVAATFPDVGRLVLSTWVPLAILAGAFLSLATGAFGRVLAPLRERSPSGKQSAPTATSRDTGSGPV